MLTSDIIRSMPLKENMSKVKFASKILCDSNTMTEWNNLTKKANYKQYKIIAKAFGTDKNAFLNIGEKIFTGKPKKKLAVVDLFSGVGGLSYGFAHNKNFEVLLANEYEKDIAKAYTLNHPEVKMLNCDIKNINEQILKDLIPLPIDVVIGGPPCQSYSTLGKRKNDERAHLFKEYCRILKITQPQIFIFENVTGILSMQGGQLFQDVKNAFQEIGYSLKYKVLNAADYGVPEIRKRVILVGTKGKNTFEFPKPTHGDKPGLKPYVTLEDALSDMPILKSGQEMLNYKTKATNDFQKFVHDVDILTDNMSPKNGEHLIKIMETLPDGGSKNDLPEEIRPESGFGNTYAKMWWKKPAPTITRNFACPSSSRCIHPRDSRALSTREGARLQSFPDSYKFYGSRTMKNLEIGNAVPPLLSIALAKQVNLYFKRRKNEI